MINLYDYQLEALQKLKNGSVLCGGVGSGKSIVSLAYFIKTCGGDIYKPRFLQKPMDLYIITTAKKRNSLEWVKECGKFCISRDQNNSLVKLTIDSWNNIKKYTKIYNAFFIFDEQRVIGSGIWVKSFLNIARKNKWILLSATPGDKWIDYVPLFVANGFYKNKTEFQRIHCIFSRFAKYPKIEGYIHEKLLEKYRNNILVPMDDLRDTHRNHILKICDYDKNKFKTIWRDRWNPYENIPIEETGKLCYLMRRVCNEDISRIKHCKDIIKNRKKVIIFYNFNYEAEILENICKELKIKYAIYNGHKHEDLPDGDEWVYIVQYTAGSEGWNCVTTDTIIFYSQTYSYKQYEQSCGRIDRINTLFKELYYYDLRSSCPIDVAISKALRDKKDFNERKFLKI